MIQPVVRNSGVWQERALPGIVWPVRHSMCTAGPRQELCGITGPAIPCWLYGLALLGHRRSQHARHGMVVRNPEFPIFADHLSLVLFHEVALRIDRMGGSFIQRCVTPWDPLMSRWAY